MQPNHIPSTEQAGAEQHAAGAEQPRLSIATLPVQNRSAASGDEADYSSLVRNFDVTRTFFVPAGMSLKADVDTEGIAAVVVYGHVAGSVRAGSQPVFVMPDARVDGQVSSDGEVVVAGAVGTDSSSVAVATQGRFVLAAGGRVVGDVQYRSLRVHEGGTIEGRLMPAASRTA